MTSNPADKYAGAVLEREFIGYGMDSPDPQWPGGANIAVSFVINYSAGAELSLLHGDTEGETHLTEIPARAKLLGKRFDMIEGQYEYGAREGVPRLLRLFEEYGMKCTWNVSTLALEQAPYWAKALVESGSEISCAGKRYLDYANVAPEVEEQHILEAITSLQTITGDKTLPHGWFVDRPSNISTLLYTRAHSSLHLPTPYSSDSSSDELPFWVPSPLAAEGKEDTGLLMVPMSHDTGDWKFSGRGAGWASPKDFHQYLKDTFDILYEEGEEGQGKMMTVVLHPHVVGHGGRTFYLEKFLQYIKSQPKVWVATRSQIAEHWATRFPYDPTKAFGQTKNVACW
ncbi:allantoinase, partial [Phenoliferia sp. Uapishka_3]